MYATGDLTNFGYNILIDVVMGAEYISHVDNLVDNPTGSTNIFGAPAGQGLGAGASGFGVDPRDASSGILIAPLPLDNIPLFSFDVQYGANLRDDIIKFQAFVGSGNTAALTYPDASFPPIVLGQDYPNIEFGSLAYGWIPAPGSAAPLALFGLAAARRRRRLIRSSVRAGSTPTHKG